MQGPWICGGFSFSDKRQADQAAKEVDAVDYLRKRLEGVHPEVVHEMYQQITEQKLFSTPVGYSYLKELRDYLTVTAGYEENQVEAVPVEMISAETILEDEHKDAPPQKENVSTRKERPNSGRQMDEAVVKRLQGRVQVLLGVNVLLVIAIIAMFLITLTSGNTTILNYENEIIDKYESWEQELEQREAQLEEREAQLAE